MLLGVPPPDPGFEFLVASQGMSQGLLQTEGPQVLPRATVRFGQIQLGAQWRNINSPAAEGIAAVFVKVRRTAGRTQLEGALLYRVRTGAGTNLARTAWEFDGGFRRTFGKVAVRMIAEYAPREFEAGSSLYVEAGPSLAVAKHTTLSFNIGRRQRAGPDYSTFNAGLSHALGGKCSVEARLFATDHPDRGPRYATRLILSARFNL